MKRIVSVGLAALSAITFLVAGSSEASAAGESKKVARGRYLVTVSGCNDCHTPLKMGQNGPEPDLTRMLSGHPRALVMPPPPKLGGPWLAGMAATMTAFAGPWGVSYAANLTPDDATGIGKWTERNFVETVRNGRHLGRGRPLLPPMPFQNVGQMSDEDLSAVFAFLRSIPPIENEVPQPQPPELAAK